MVVRPGNEVSASERDKQVAVLVNKVARAFASNTFLANVRESLVRGEKKKASFPLDYYPM